MNEAQPSHNRETRRLEDRHGAAARRLDKLRQAARLGYADPADLLAARRELAQAVAALELHRAASEYRRKPTPNAWRAALAAALAALTAGGRLPSAQDQQQTAALGELLALGVTPP